MKHLSITFVFVALALSGCTSSSGLYLRGESTHELYGPVTDGYRLCTFNLGHEWYVVHKPSPEALAFFHRLVRTRLPGIDFADAKPQDVVDFLRNASVEYAPSDLRNPAPVPIALDLSQLSNATRQSDGRLTFVEDGRALYATMPETVTLYARTIDLWWAIKGFAHQAHMTATIENQQVILKPVVYVQQDESTEPSKAAPSASSDVR